VPAVRGDASGLAGTGARVAAGVGEMPETVAGWAVSDAAVSAEDVARHRLAVIGTDIAATARQIIAAVVDYEAADERAATRLRDAR
jgi:hypothetical protein